MLSRYIFLTAMALLLISEARLDSLKRKKEYRKQRASEDLNEERQFQDSIGIRLVGGNNPAEGRVELYLYPHGWGTVCDNWFENIDAEVACRMLGFSGGEAFGNAFFGEGRGEIVLDHLECTGSESDLWDCPRGGRGEHNCLHAHDASVRCDVVRLVGGSGPHEGRVEVLHEGVWGTVCDDWWGDLDAHVVCRQLGMTRGEAAVNAEFGQGTGPILLDSVDCNGDELFIADCSHDDWGVHDCTHGEDAGAICGNDEPSSDSTCILVRLIGGSGAHEGRVELFRNGEWGTVCDDWWEDQNAQVVCRQLGMTGGRAVIAAWFGEGTGPIMLDTVECNGDEMTLVRCAHTDWGIHDCSHSEDAGVICDPGSDEIGVSK